MNAGSRPFVAGGVLHLDGEPRLLLAGDYPYYRDEPSRWRRKLAAMRDAGLDVVTCYVPWRHHEVRGRHVFTGPGNRDLVGFLAEIERAGLLAMAKPGPYVHAELPIGGLPDRVSPTVDPGRAAALNASGEPLRCHGRALPSPEDPAFAADVAAWLAAVGDALRPWQYPGGPLIAVQVGNEGTYGETALPIDGYDYARAAAAGAPRGWTAPETRYGLRQYLRWAESMGRALRDDLRHYAMRLGLDVPAFANLSPPAHATRAGRAGPGRYDAWTVRVHGFLPPPPAGDPAAGDRPVTGSPVADRPASGVVHYGRTGWTGDAATDDEALVNSVLSAGCAPGPSLEENWSLPWADRTWQIPASSIFHAVLGLATGGTGLTVYTACATAGWGGHLAVAGDGEGEHEPVWARPPYGGAAPIAADGSPGTGLPALRVLTAFLSTQGADLVTAAPAADVRWYGQRDYAALAAWSPPPGAVLAGHGLPAPQSATLAPFVRACLRRSVGFRLLYGAEPGGDRIALSPEDGPVVAASAFFMARADQSRLARFVAGGGALLLLGELPTLDGAFRPCTVLADAIGSHGSGGPSGPGCWDGLTDSAGWKGSGGLGGPAATGNSSSSADTDGLGGPAASRRSGNSADTGGSDRVGVLASSEIDEDGLVRWLGAHVDGADRPAGLDLIRVRRVPSSGGAFVFLLNRSARGRRVDTEVDGLPLAVDLAGYGVAAVRVAQGRILACYLKGIDERTGNHVRARLRYAGHPVDSSEPCDLSIVDGAGGWSIRHTGGPRNRIDLPEPAGTAVAAVSG